MHQSNDDDDEPGLVALLAELGAAYSGLRDHFSYSSSRLHRLLERLRRPNLPELRYDLPFHVEQWDGETAIRLMSASANLLVARGAFDAAVAAYPNYRWLLREGTRVVKENQPCS